MHYFPSTIFIPLGILVGDEAVFFFLFRFLFGRVIFIAVSQHFEFALVNSTIPEATYRVRYSRALDIGARRNSRL